MKNGYFLLLLLFPAFLLAQDRTIGVFQNDSLAFNGYTLFSPNTSMETYLIDNCGHLLNRWSSAYRPGLAAYLLEDGSLLRTARISSNFNAGGTGGRLEKYSWDGILKWSYDYSNDWVHQHHDIEPLPNGNILILAWERQERATALEAGRDSQLVTSAGVWLEHVIEVALVGTDEISIVWEWYVRDHLVQDYDASKANYGVVADHPELIDFNYTPMGPNPDWLHANAIDYNPELDQIVLSSRNFNEFWIIDHSTTTEEAAGHTGGKTGQGGDLLYRWGNPQAYDRGAGGDQVLFGQHHVNWIPAGYPDAGKLILFNNGLNRPAGEFSSVEILDPPLAANGQYTLATGAAYGPQNVFWSYEETDFYAARISGAEQLPNGNVLICEGSKGRFVEVSPEGEQHWEYISPIRLNGPVSQGTQIGGNEVFRVSRYAPDHPFFEGRTLVPGPLLELEPLPEVCQIYPDQTSSTGMPTELPGLQFYPNPVGEVLQVQWEGTAVLQWQINDVWGRLVQARQLLENGQSLSTTDWASGLYLVQVIANDGRTIYTKKLLKE